jgi:two-component system phosphate regulon sensor histidine kinase PhoR
MSQFIILLSISRSLFFDMSIALSYFILFLTVWLLAGVILVLHRYSPKVGFAPLFILLGGLTAAMQLQTLGWFQLQLEKTVINLDSYIIFPIVLFGLLVIYVINGTVRAQVTILGVLLVTCISAIFQILLPLYASLPGFAIIEPISEGYSLKVLFASLAALCLDVIVMVVVYQLMSNLRSRFPSRLAGGLALLAALWCDSLLFPLFLSLGDRTAVTTPLTHFVAKTVVGLALWPLLSFYLHRVGSRYPDSAATISRPVFDLFTTTQQFESRALYHYSLLRTMSQIDQLVVRSTDQVELLQQACELIVENRAYNNIWIGLATGHVDEFQLAAEVGPKIQDLERIIHEKRHTSCRVAFLDGKAVIVNHLVKAIEFDEQWRQDLLAMGCKSCASFPMRYGDQNRGVMTVCATEPDSIALEEIELLQDLADDLAYALASIDTRTQQTIFQTATDTMRDGLLITDLVGKIIYANSIVAGIFGLSTESLVSQNIGDLIPPERANQLLGTYQQISEKDEWIHEVSYPSDSEGERIILINATLMHDSQGEPKYVVANIHDITRRRDYERQLLTLNRLTAELVQIHDTHDLMDAILRLGEELLKADGGGIYIVDEQTMDISEMLMHNVPQEYAQRIARDYRRGLPGDTARQTLQPVMVSDVLNDGVYGEHIHFMADYNIRALLILPILFREHPIGALTLYYQQPHDFSENESQIGRTLAQTLAIVIQNVRLYESISRRAEEMAALVTATATVSSSLNITEVLYIVAEQMTKILGLQACAISNYDPDNGAVTLLAEFGPEGWEVDEHWYQPYYLEEYPLTRKVIETNTPSQLRIDDPDLDGAEHKFMLNAGIKTLLMIPLVVQEHAIGLVELMDDSIERIFTDHEISLGQTLASQAAIAIQNADLYQQSQAYADELEDRVEQRTIELRQAKEHIEGILESVPDAVFVLDEHNALIQANQAGETLLQKARQYDLEIFDPDFVAHLLRGGLGEDSILEVEERYYQALASPLSIEQDQPLGQVIVFRDVSRFRELDQMKTQFVSDVSHELRTPLTNMMLYLGLLSLADEEESTRQAYLETMQRETERLTHLIEDLLTISRLEAGRIAIQLRGVDINLLVDELAGDRAALAAESGIALTRTLHPDIPPVLMDSDLLVQAVSNLLTNAINYTLAGGTVDLSTAIEQEEDQKWVVIRVKDNGVGIEPDEINRIFERFYRGSASRRLGSAGTGLGLAISNEIVTRMDGDITVESTPGEGSIFTVWLKPATDGML